MTYGNDMIKRIKDFNKNLEGTVTSIARNKTEELKDAQVFQTLSGLGNDGKYLMRYQDDPYFKGDLFAAAAYMEYKKRYSPNVQKPADVMDGYITGLFHSQWQVKVKKKTLEITNTSPIYGELEEKNDNTMTGFNEDTAKETFYYSIRPRLMKEVRKQTGAK